MTQSPNQPISQSTAPPLRLAIAGVGWAGTRQAQAAQEVPGHVQVVALIDNDVAFLREKSGELGIAQTYTDYAAALADLSIDAVSICTPHALHGPMTLDAAAAGKHVLVEKPMARDVDEATRMIDAAKANDVTLYVAENEPYTPMSQFLRAEVQTGRTIGELTHVILSAGFRAEDFGYPGRRAWLTQPQQGGTGTWTLHGIHTVAQLRYIVGEVETVYVQEHKAASYRRRELEGTVSGLLTLASGAHVSILQTSETRLPGTLKGYILHGDRGSLRASPAGCELFQNSDAPTWVEYPPETRSSYAEELVAFAATIAGQQQGPTTGASERRSLAIVQAGYESMTSGQPIHLPTRFGPM